jgi:hypothetical protein
VATEQERLEAEKKIRGRYAKLKTNLTERARRLFAASEASALGHGGVAIVSRATGLARNTIKAGLHELNETERGMAPLVATRSRRPGGGRKRTVDKDPTLLRDLKKLVESTTRGDPESPLLWTARSLRHLAEGLEKQEHETSPAMVARLLKTLGYSLQSNRKRMEGAQHPDRNAQFERLHETMRQRLEAGEPVLSVDTKKKELVGDFKNAGKELRKKGDPEEVQVYDFIDPDQGRAVPYGVYDLKKNEAWVSVGLSHDTSEFAVQAVRTWWHEMGKTAYPRAISLLLTADSGGSNGYRVRLWKLELQALANELGFPITVCHLPPGTSKWNKIEHRLFSFITQNWRGKPLVTHQVIVNLIAATTTKTGLRVRAHLDERTYAKGRRISDKQMAEVHLEPHDFHGEWNYTIHPTISHGAND